MFKTTKTQDLREAGWPGGEGIGDAMMVEFENTLQMHLLNSQTKIYLCKIFFSVTTQVHTHSNYGHHSLF